MKKLEAAYLLVFTTYLAACSKDPNPSPESRTKAVSGTSTGADTQAANTNTAQKSGESPVPGEPTTQDTPAVPQGGVVMEPATNTGLGADMGSVEPNPTMEPMIVVSPTETAEGPVTLPTQPLPPPAPTPAPAPAPAPTPQAPTVFKKGDPFQPGTMMLSQMVASLVESQKYLETKAPKAIAVNAKGLGMVAVLSTQASPADAKRAAIEGCYVIGGFQPCTTLVLGDTYEVDSQGLSNPATFNESLPTPRTLTDVPFIDPAQSDLMITSYLKIKSPKAIAISLDGIKVAVTEEKLDSLEEAKRLAIQRCELTAKLIPCFLFATNDDITFGPKTASWSLSVKFDSVEIKTKGAQAPGISRERLSDLTDGGGTYTDRVSQDKNLDGIVYLSTISGNVGWSTPSHNLLPNKDYKASAKARCESFDGPDTCVAVIEKTKVSVSPTTLPSSPANFGAARCKAMPRASCEAHKAAGCLTSGNYYLMDKTAAVELKPCTF